MNLTRSNWLRATLLALALPLTQGAWAQTPPQPTHALQGTHTLPSTHSFSTLVSRVEAAVTKNKMGLVATASASAGAAGRGIKIPGNAVLMVFRNDYAVRMLQASVPAGIEAPIRFYVTENADGTASLTYRTPSAVFAPYASATLNAIAAELDPVFERIAHDATQP